ncbi:probable leucine-rich repeat receptor-like protein kinase At1g68400 [Fagus crenata]
MECIRDAPNGMILWLQRIGNSGGTGLVRVTHWFDSAPSSQPQEKPSLWHHSRPPSPTSRHSSYCSSHTTTSPAGSLRPFRLDLSYNNFSGEVPVAVNALTHLLTLRLEENRFTGSISGLNLQNLQDFNVSGNHFSGEIPKSLSGFPESAFAQNQALCGSPVKETCKNSFSDPTWPASENGAIASPLIPGTPNPNHHSSILLINYFSGSGPAILLINYQRSYQL